ncbi:hypothetical protein ACFQO7_02155 [Catellatospora aurea]|uniref:Uncharacterized protein n=1 Tax=Catellatospora aurea TaxID=1337874 RepID=A0ABW2GMP8_9ACTN
MSMPWLSRFGAVCGVILALSLGVPGVVEPFTGETTVTSFVAGLGAAFMVFIAGSVLFGVSMLRARVLPRVAAAGYIVSLVMLAALAPLPDSLLSSAAHIAAAASLVWLSAAVWAVPSTREP